MVLDTSILIDRLRGAPRARATLVGASRRQERLVASVLTRTEILAGTRAGEETAVYSLFDALEWIPVDEMLAERAGHIARTYLRSHPGIDLTDFAIAATAEVLDADLWTRNIKHFPMLERVRNPCGT